MDLIKFFEPLLQLIFPHLCLGCGSYLNHQESHFCLICGFQLPRYEDLALSNSSLVKTFWGRIPLESAYALLSLKKNNLGQKILHAIKYRKQEELGTYMGDLFARRLLQIEFRKPDILVPVPLHSKKEAQRGYNQSQKIAEGLASKLGIPIRNDLIKRIHYNKSQTQRNRLERWKNSEGLFQLTHVSRMENVHLAIVDDVITTGSTIEAVANELLKLEGVKLSVYSLAFTD